MEMVRLKLNVTLVLLTRLMCSADYTNEVTRLAIGAT